MRAEGAHRACFRVAGDDAHDGREAPAAQRAPARLIPQHGRALDAEPAVAALEQNGVGGALHAHDAWIDSICDQGVVALIGLDDSEGRNMDFFVFEFVAWAKLLADA